MSFAKKPEVLDPLRLFEAYETPPVEEIAAEVRAQELEQEGINNTGSGSSKPVAMPDADQNSNQAKMLKRRQGMRAVSRRRGRASTINTMNTGGTLG